MHEELMTWLRAIKRAHPHVFSHRWVFEGGSLDVNGSPRELFEECEYVGVDWRDGPGVDVVSLIHEALPGESGTFGTVICTETLEHDPYWRESVARMVDLIAPGGSLILSTAGPGRGKHRVGTSPTGDHYGNMELVELLGVVLGAGGFDLVEASWSRGHHDIYVFCDGKLEG